MKNANWGYQHDSHFLGTVRSHRKPSPQRVSLLSEVSGFILTLGVKLWKLCLCVNVCVTSQLTPARTPRCWAHCWSLGWAAGREETLSHPPCPPPRQLHSCSPPPRWWLGRLGELVGTADSAGWWRPQSAASSRLSGLNSQLQPAGQ